MCVSHRSAETALRGSSTSCQGSQCSKTNDGKEEGGVRHRWRDGGRGEALQNKTKGINNLMKEAWEGYPSAGARFVGY